MKDMSRLLSLLWFETLYLYHCHHSVLSSFLLLLLLLLHLLLPPHHSLLSLLSLLLPTLRSYSIIPLSKRHKSRKGPTSSATGHQALAPSQPRHLPHAPITGCKGPLPLQCNPAGGHAGCEEAVKQSEDFIATIFLLVTQGPAPDCTGPIHIF